jgi:hypothetical protein
MARKAAATYWFDCSPLADCCPCDWAAPDPKQAFLELRQGSFATKNAWVTIYIVPTT